MSLGLTNTPASFQNFINDVLAPFLNRFVTMYLDKILIYSDTLKEHRGHMRSVLTTLSKEGLHRKPEKCKFHREEVKCLVMIIGWDRVKMNQAKVAVLSDWHFPKCLFVVWSFLSFANFYRYFISALSSIVQTLTALTGNEVKFTWSDECQQAFRKIKKVFTSALILAHFDRNREAIVETDAFDIISVGILLQHSDHGVLPR